ncbi:site-2 protease family protein [Rickettsiales bacterium]|nr:site-2 protease family protein [Rickettsiales bacterium]
MKTKNSINIAKLFGINVQIHWSFLFLLLFFFFSSLYQNSGMEEAIARVLFIISIFGCVILHEFGHALTARKFGCKTKRIIIFPLGGIAEMAKLPEKPSQEFLVAIAGPMVNFVIAALLYLHLESFQYLDFEENNLIKNNFTENLLNINIILGVFNLIPAFPMDGGRILRSLLAIKFNRAKATKIAANLGQFIAIIFIILGFSYNIFLIFIGIFIFIAAHNEDLYEESRSAISNYKIKNLMMTNYSKLNENDHLDKVINIVLSSQEKEFVISNNDNQPVGILTQNDIIKSLSLKKNYHLYDIMNKNFLKFTENDNLKISYDKMLETQNNIVAITRNARLIAILNLENIQEFLLFNKISK